MNSNTLSIAPDHLGALEDHGDLRAGARCRHRPPRRPRRPPPTPGPTPRRRSPWRSGAPGRGCRPGRRRPPAAPPGRGTGGRRRPCGRHQQVVGLGRRLDRPLRPVEHEPASAARAVRLTPSPDQPPGLGQAPRGHRLARQELGQDLGVPAVGPSVARAEATTLVARSGPGETSGPSPRPPAPDPRARVPRCCPRPSSSETRRPSTPARPRGATSPTGSRRALLGPLAHWSPPGRCSRGTSGWSPGRVPGRRCGAGPPGVLPGGGGSHRALACRRPPSQSTRHRRHKPPRERWRRMGATFARCDGRRQGFLRRCPLPAGLPPLLRSAGRRRPGGPVPRGRHARPERREPPAVGVRRRARAEDAGCGGRPHARAVAGRRAPPLRGAAAPALLDDVERGAEGGVAAAPVLVVVCGDAVHRTRGDPGLARSSRPCRTSSWRRTPSGWARP